MPVDRVVLEPEPGQLGQEVVGEPGVDAEPQPGGRVVEHDELVELVPDALGRHDLETIPRRSTTASTSSGTA